MPRDENRGFGNHTNAGAGCTEVQPCGLRCSRPSFDRDDPLRAAFVLVDLEGEMVSDAAAALGIPEGSLWRRVFQARTRLRAALGGDS